MNKKIICIFLLYFFQLIATSCIDTSCNCNPDPGTYERIYKNLQLKPLDILENQVLETSEIVHKSSFGLRVFLDLQLNRIADSKSKFNFSSFGFRSAYACSCGDSDKYIEVDPIGSVIITAIDTQNQEIIDVTNNFITLIYERELTINKLFQYRGDDYWYDDDVIHIDTHMVEYDNIPDSSIFKVKIILKSGIELVQQTEVINFEEQIPTQ